MSTIYDFDEKNAFESIEIHYFNDGYDLENYGDADGVCIYEADGNFNKSLVEDVKDVFVGENISCIVVVDDEDDFAIYTMTTEEFRSVWSESVWAKFRADRKVVCKLCGEKQAEFVSGATYMERLEQYYCDACHEAYITNGNGKFMRKGVLKEPLYERDYW